MGRASDHLSVAQFDLLRWVEGGCEDGVYQGSSHRVSARALHNRGFLIVSGGGKTWSAQVTAEGTRRVQEEAKRIEAERERARRVEEAEAEQKRKEQDLRDRATELLADVVAAGGRLELGADAKPEAIRRMQNALGSSGLLPDGQRLAQEPTGMDPIFGVTVYLEPDFNAVTAMRSFGIPRQLRDPHPTVIEFQNKKALVSKTQMSRAARFLQAFISAAEELEWKIPAKGRYSTSGQGEPVSDFHLRRLPRSSPSRSVNSTGASGDGRHMSPTPTTTCGPNEPPQIKGLRRRARLE